jgi:hypothetical protein
VPHPRHETLRLSPDGVRLLVDYEVAAGEAALALRRAFDRDGNGALDPGEQQALTENLTKTAVLRTRLLLDGAEVPLRREAVRPEKTGLPAASAALLAVRVELSAAWPPEKKKNVFFALFLDTARDVELRDEDPAGHVPVSAECVQCRVTTSNSGVADGNFVRGADTPLRLTVKWR